MKLIDAIKFQGKPVYIPDCGRDSLPEFLVEMGYKKGAEIGVYKGAYTEKFCRAGLTMYAIDPWMAYQGAGRTQKEQERQDFLYGHTQRVLSPFPNVAIVRKTSMAALEDFEDEALDFVYIDGDHRFPAVTADIYWWSNKVKKGGIISGHDYFNTSPTANNVICHAKAAVDAFIEVFNIPSFYTFGRSKPIEEEAKDDKYLSWMFFKP